MPKRLVILHGYTAHPTSHWFPWLAQTFAPLGVDVAIPELPATEAPEPQAWVGAAAQAIGRVDDDLVIVGHSLGCITALHALARVAEPWSLGGLVMVSGFDGALNTLPELAPFTATVPDLARISAATRHRSVITASDDQIVPASASAALAAHLDAELETLPTGGHFLDREGCRALPAARDRVASAFGFSRERMGGYVST